MSTYAIPETPERTESTAAPPPVDGTPTPPRTVILRSPISGTVSAVNAAAGSVVQSGEPIVTLYDEGKLTFQARVSPVQLKHLRLGMAAKVTGPGLARPIDARLDH